MGNFVRFQDEFKKKYLKVLKKQMTEGLVELSRMKITDDKFKEVVINLNNCNNIALQLNADLTKENDVVEESKNQDI